MATAPRGTPDVLACCDVGWLAMATEPRGVPDMLANAFGGISDVAAMTPQTMANKEPTSKPVGPTIPLEDAAAPCRMSMATSAAGCACVVRNAGKSAAQSGKWT